MIRLVQIMETVDFMSPKFPPQEQLVGRNGFVRITIVIAIIMIY